MKTSNSLTFHVLTFVLIWGLQAIVGNAAEGDVAADAIPSDWKGNATHGPKGHRKKLKGGHLDKNGKWMVDAVATKGQGVSKGQVANDINNLSYEQSVEDSVVDEPDRFQAKVPPPAVQNSNKYAVNNNQNQVRPSGSNFNQGGNNNQNYRPQAQYGQNNPAPYYQNNQMSNNKAPYYQNNQGSYNQYNQGQYNKNNQGSYNNNNQGQYNQNNRYPTNQYSGQYGFGPVVQSGQSGVQQSSQKIPIKTNQNQYKTPAPLRNVPLNASGRQLNSTINSKATTKATTKAPPKKKAG